jgi:pimeloyl-ACP methyl ester carboxylesterase
VYTPAGQAELTLALMDALGVQRAALLGHSAGAPVALDAALVSPERCPVLVMAGGGTCGLQREPCKQNPKP